jgi:hypothetical protein
MRELLAPAQVNEKNSFAGADGMSSVGEPGDAGSKAALFWARRGLSRWKISLFVHGAPVDEAQLALNHARPLHCQARLISPHGGKDHSVCVKASLASVMPWS